MAKFKVTTHFAGDTPYVLKTDDLEAAIADLRDSLNRESYLNVTKVTLKAKAS